MTSASRLLLTTVVTRALWDADPEEVLRSTHAAMAQRARRQGLRLLGESHEAVEILPGGKRVRIALGVDTAPSTDGVLPL